MNDDGRPRPRNNDDPEPLEFLNKEPDDMADQPPRDEFEDETLEDNGFEEDTYEEDVVQEELPYDEEPPPARRRTLAGGGGTNRVMIATGVVVVAAALFIFWPRGGGELPDPVGDQFSVVAADSGAYEPPQTARPRSSDVNLSLEAPAVVPEETGADNIGSGDTTPPPTTSQTTESVAIANGDPSPDGKWAIQLESFGSRLNAQELANRLRTKGFRVETPTLQSTTGGSSTKVWIAYFETHAAAKTWAAAHEDEIGKSTYITHR